jgi:hypothetical protein
MSKSQRLKLIKERHAMQVNGLAEAVAVVVVVSVHEKERRWAASDAKAEIVKEEGE